MPLALNEDDEQISGDDDDPLARDEALAVDSSPAGSTFRIVLPVGGDRS